MPELKPGDKVFVYDKYEEMTVVRELDQITITKRGNRYHFGTWVVEEWQVSLKKETLVDRLLQIELDRHNLLVNKIKSLCVE